METTTHTCLKLEIPEAADLIFVKRTWYQAHFELSVTDGLNAWLCNVKPPFHILDFAEEAYRRQGCWRYPYDIKKDDPLVMVRQEQERLSKLEMLKLRGKGPPKKGQGKCAAKRSK